MHERKVEMASRAGGFIGLPGGYGTFEEVFEVTTWTQLGIHEKRVTSLSFLLFIHCDSKSCWNLAVVLLNVLGFYGPLRDIIRNGVKAGFIQPSNERLITFVDGPDDLTEHGAFDWGKGNTTLHDFS